MIFSLTGAPGSAQQAFPQGLFQASSHRYPSGASEPHLSPQSLLSLPPAGLFIKGCPLKTRVTLYKESTCNVGDLASIPGPGRSPGEGNGLPTPVFWPGKFHRLYSPWGHKELDTTE